MFSTSTAQQVQSGPIYFHGGPLHGQVIAVDHHPRIVMELDRPPWRAAYELTTRTKHNLRRFDLGSGDWQVVSMSGPTIWQEYVTVD